MTIMFRTASFLMIPLLSTLSTPQASKEQEIPSGSRYYLAARADLRTSNRVWIRGLTNLPSTSKIMISIGDRLGQGSKIVGEEASAIVRSDGTFDAEVYSRKGMEFQKSFVCSVAFFPENQNAEVTRVVGKKGEHLGFPRNPLAHVGSGERHYLELLTVVTE